MHGNIKDLTGERFGNLVVLELTELKPQKKREAVWKCRCDCGNICYKTSSTLQDKRRLTWSCGCQNKRKRIFPNKFVPKTSMKKSELTRVEFADKLLEHFKNAPFKKDLQDGINKVLEECQNI